MAFKRSKSRITIPIVEMTPMIDIVFLLIIFFMVAAQFAQQAHVNLNLPKEIGEQIEDKPRSTLVINILEDGSFVIDNSEGSITLEQVDLIVASTVKDNDVDWKNISIRADQNSLAGSLNEVLVILSKHGLSATNIATESP
jgi:biopolymer transport protein ExbD